MRIDISLALTRLRQPPAVQPGGPTPDTGFVFLADPDGALLTDPDGAYLQEPTS